MKSLLTALAFCASVSFCVAQSPAKATTNSETAQEQIPFLKNAIKVNVSSLALKNFNLSYERSITRKTSFVAGYSFIPESNLGEMAVVQKMAAIYLDENSDLRDHIQNTNMSFHNMTGEFRYYFGKQAGARGFYAGAYGRYASMSFTFLDNYNSSSASYELPYNGTLNGFGGGLMVGAQWLLTDHISLDWYIAGAHYGNTGGDINITQDFSELSETERMELETQIEEQSTVAGRQLLDATVTSTGVHGKVDAPFAGIRAFGLNLGYKF